MLRILTPFSSFFFQTASTREQRVKAGALYAGRSAAQTVPTTMDRLPLSVRLAKYAVRTTGTRSEQRYDCNPLTIRCTTRVSMKQFPFSLRETLNAQSLISKPFGSSFSTKGHTSDSIHPDKVVVVWSQNFLSFFKCFNAESTGRYILLPIIMITKREISFKKLDQMQFLRLGT